MYEASKAMSRRKGVPWFKGNGIDIGAGPDCIDKYKNEFGFTSCRNWDLVDGDAQYLAGVADSTYDFVHSSHCLEHMVDVKASLKNWIRVCKSGGYIIITVPDEEMYEHNMWPSRFNGDHKWSFRIFRGTKLHAKSLNVFDLLSKVWKDVEIIKVERIETSWNKDDPRDQTLGDAECCIEIVLRKN